MNHRQGQNAIPVLIGPLTGPLHGVSVINNALAELLRVRGVLFETIDLSPGWHSGVCYHLARIRRVLAGMVHMLRSGRRRYVMSLDGGGGLIYNILLALVARATCQPLILYHHSSSYVVHDRALMRVLLATAGHAPHIFCSPKMAQLFWDRYGSPCPTLLINNAAWIEAQQPGSATREEALIRLGFMSALTPEKGLGRAIETLRRINSMGARAELRLAGLAGDESARMIKQACGELGGQLTSCGVLTGEEKARFLQGLDYFLFPSLYPHETQSLVVPEALSAGLPVIAYDHRFVGELLGEGCLVVGSQEEFAHRAADWIVAGQGLLPVRRRQATAHFDALRKDAAGQIDRLVVWCLAENDHDEGI